MSDPVTMPSPSPRRPWYRRKRAWAALAMWLLLPVLYPLSYGPYFYCRGRRWVTRETVAFYAPIERAVPAVWGPIDGPCRFPWCLFLPGHPANDWYRAYLEWCDRLGRRHAASDSPTPAARPVAETGPIKRVIPKASLTPAAHRPRSLPLPPASR